MDYAVELDGRAKRELEAFSDRLALRIGKQLRRLAVSPRPRQSKKLRGSPFYRIRVGNYRVIYAVSDEEKRVTILNIGHRREVYRGK